MKDANKPNITNVKKELALTKRKLRESLEFNERLRSVIGFDDLKGWQPQERIKKQYGWVYAWLYPLHSYMNQNLNMPLTPEIRNKISSIVTSIISQLSIQGKFGVKLSHDPREVDIEQFMEKQSNYFKYVYEPCAICGENRITHECHIIPRTEGGPLHRDNFILLCPLHHHLFDNSRLLESEWQILLQKIEGKMEAAAIYAKEVRLPKLQLFWQEKR